MHSSRSDDPKEFLRLSALDQALSEDRNHTTCFTSDVLSDTDVGTTNQIKNQQQSSHQEKLYHNLHSYINRHKSTRAKDPFVSCKASHFLKEQLKFGSFERLQDRRESKSQQLDRFIRRRHPGRLAPVMGSEARLYEDPSIDRPHTAEPTKSYLESLFDSNNHQSFLQSIEDSLTRKTRSPFEPHPMFSEDEEIGSQQRSVWFQHGLLGDIKRSDDVMDSPWGEDLAPTLRPGTSPQEIGLPSPKGWRQRASLVEERFRRLTMHDTLSKRPSLENNSPKLNKQGRRVKSFASLPPNQTRTRPSTLPKQPHLSVGPYAMSDVHAAMQLFAGFDTDGSGDVDMQEFIRSTAWQRSPIASSLQSMFDSIDKDQSNLITLPEFLQAVFPLARGSEIRSALSFLEERGNDSADKAQRKSLSSEDVDEIKSIFRLLDKDNSQTVDITEFLKLQSSGGILSDEDLKVFFQSHDLNQDSQLDLQEFMKLYQEYFTCTD